jgi:hypothetical protein
MLSFLGQDWNLRNVRSYVCVSILSTFVLASLGCREQPTTVEGVVTLDGQPLAIEKGMRGSVVFQPAASEGATLTGLIDAKGHYELASGGSVVVPPRAYWVTVSAMELVPASEDQPQSSGRLITPAKYASATDSGFRIEVQPGPNKVDLAMTSAVELPADDHEPADDEPATEMAPAKESQDAERDEAPVADEQAVAPK